MLRYRSEHIFLIMNDTLNSISKTHKRIYLEKHRNILDA